MILSCLLFGRVTPTKLFVLLILLSTTLRPALSTISAEPDAAANSETDDDKAERERRQKVKLAVALNYCRASFHRINKFQTQKVLKEEKQRILNNLDLSSIDDVEVIKLYTNVINEINEIELVDTERDIIKEHHNRTFGQKIFANMLAVSAQAATFNYVGAASTGVSSFWDYQATRWNIENETWKIEKGHLNSLTRKTTDFIETSWKLARERKIPDEWLIRDRDIEQMYQSLAEPNLEKRLRILRRMESYLQCFPPFYYYVARLEQSLGNLEEAAETYRKLRELEQGHMRQDDMLAAALTNLALIEHHFGEPRAVQTARQALRESTDVWEANLVCANILAESGEFAIAEDAVLRNLDVALEQDNSRNALAMVYARSGDTAKLARRLNDAEFVGSLKGPVLLKCALAMGSQGLPIHANRKLLASLHGHVNLNSGRDDLIITASEDWNLAGAQLRVSYAGVDLGQPQVTRRRGQMQLAYRGILEIGSAWRQTRGVRPIALQVQFPDQEAVAFQLTPGGMSQARQALQLAGLRQTSGAQPNRYVLTGVKSPEFLVAFDGRPTQTFDRQLATPEESKEDDTEVTQQDSKEDYRKYSAATASQSDRPKVRFTDVNEAGSQSNEEEQTVPDGPVRLLLPE